MRVPWLALAVVSVTLLAGYLVFALIVGTTVSGIEVRLRHGYLVTAAAAIVAGLGLAAVRRRAREPDRALEGVALASASMLACLLAVDTVFDVRAKRQLAPLLAEEAADPTIPVHRLYPPMFHPTARNFTIYRPGFQSAGAVYGDLYSPELRRSPTLMASVLERRWVATAIDDHGFRAGVALDDATVLALGDSYVANPSLTQDRVWPTVLAAAIGEPVYNLGVHDASPAQEVWLLEHVLTTLRPRRARRVLWMIFEGNDLENSYAREVETAPQVFDDTLVGALLVSVPSLARESSVLRRVLDGGFAARRSSWAADTRVDGVALSSPLWRSPRLGGVLVFRPYLERAAMPDSYVSRHPHRRALEGAFGEMKRLAAAHQLEVTVVLAPTFPRLYADLFGRGAAVSTTPHFLAFVERVATRAGFPTVNLAALLRPDAERELLYFRDDTHWNERGNRAVAEVLARHVFGR